MKSRREMVMCSCCLQWFCFNPNGNYGIVVKRRGYNNRYYCGECIATNKISEKARESV